MQPLRVALLKTIHAAFISLLGEFIIHGVLSSDFSYIPRVKFLE